MTTPRRTTRTKLTYTRDANLAARHKASAAPDTRPFARRVACAVAALLAAQAWGQPGEADPSPPPPEVVDAAARPARVPSLDELLGLAQPDDDAPADDPQAGSTIPEPRERDAFAAAVGLMREATDLVDAGDVGLPTQRVQADILRKLDTVIEQARQSQNQSQNQSSSSSSSQQQQQQQQQSVPDQQPGQQQSQAQSQGDNNNPSEQMPAGSTDAVSRGDVAGASASWGALPERLRDALTQGSSDHYSGLYQRLTERYYRRLAEQEEERR